MALLVCALAVVLAVQAGAIAVRLPGLHLFPKAAPRALAIVPGLFATVALYWAFLLGPSIAGAFLGSFAALLVPSLRPLHPDEDLLAKAEPLEVSGHADAKAVLLRPSGTAKAVVLICHGGGNDRIFALWHVVPRLLERGFAVVLFHLPGHGRGGSDLLDLHSFCSRFEALREATEVAVPAPVVALGQSLGGALVLDAVARSAALDGAVTVSAITRLDLGPRIARELGMVLHRPAWNALRYTSVLRLLPVPGSSHRERFPVRVVGGDHLAVFKAILGELDLERRLAAAQVAYPLLLVHGDEDAIVPVQQGRALAEALGIRATYLEAPSRHHLDPLFDDALIDRICDFVDACASKPPRPCGD